MALSRTLHELDKQVTRMVNLKVASVDDRELLKIAEFIFGTDNELLVTYREAIKQDEGAYKLSSDPIVFMGKKVD